jgi:hypothetical protein
MTFVWHTLCAALLPIALRDVPRALECFLEHLGRRNEGFRERRAAIFYRNLQADSG